MEKGSSVSNEEMMASLERLTFEVVSKGSSSSQGGLKTTTRQQPMSRQYEQQGGPPANNQHNDTMKEFMTK